MGNIIEEIRGQTKRFYPNISIIDIKFDWKLKIGPSSGQDLILKIYRYIYIQIGKEIYACKIFAYEKRYIMA